MSRTSLPPKVIFETVEGRGLTHITISVDKRDPADAGLAFLGRLLSVARDADQIGRSATKGSET